MPAAPPGAVHLAAQGARVDLRVVQAAATIGPTFDADTVSAVVGDPDARRPSSSPSSPPKASSSRANRPPAPTASGTPSCVTRHTRPRSSTYGGRPTRASRRRSPRQRRRAGPRRQAPRPGGAGRARPPRSTSPPAGRAGPWSARRGDPAAHPRHRAAGADCRLGRPRPARAHRPDAPGASVSCDVGVRRAGRAGGPPSGRGARRRGSGRDRRCCPRSSPSGPTGSCTGVRHGARAHRPPRRDGPTRTSTRGSTPEVEACFGWQQFYEADFAGCPHPLRERHGRLPRQPGGPEQSRPSGRCRTTRSPCPSSPCPASARPVATSPRRRAVGARGHRSGRGDRLPRGPFSLAFVKTFAAWNARFLGDVEKSRRLG